MKLVTAHKILLYATITLCAAIVAWGVFHFNRSGNTTGALLAGMGALGGVGFGFYLRYFINKNKG